MSENPGDGALLCNVGMLLEEYCTQKFVDPFLILHVHEHKRAYPGMGDTNEQLQNKSNRLEDDCILVMNMYLHYENYCLYICVWLSKWARGSSSRNIKQTKIYHSSAN